MIFPSPSMGLYIWDQGSDAYSHTQLAVNFTNLDGHDHSGSPKGKQIQGNGIAAGAINSTHFSPGAVNTAALGDNAVTSAKIGTGEVKSADIGNGEIHPNHFGADVIFVPPGAFMPFAGSSLPTGWLFCDGAQVNRVTYSALFNAIGTAYGSGDGSTTFNVPDLRSRVPAGKGTGGDSNALGLSDGLSVGNRTIAHSHTVNSHSHGGATGFAQPGTTSASPATDIQGSHSHYNFSPIGQMTGSSDLVVFNPNGPLMSDGNAVVFLDQASPYFDTFREPNQLGVPGSNFNQNVKRFVQSTSNAGLHAHTVQSHGHTVANHSHTIATESPSTAGGVSPYLIANYIIRT